MNENGNHKIVKALAQIRQEWEDATDGQPLDAIDGSVGLILADVAQGVGLNQEEMLRALGPLAELV